MPVCLSGLNLRWDNAYPHHAHKTGAYLERKTIVRMDWPARPQDLNPSEHA